MKVVNRETFLTLPRGTVFCKIGACTIDEPMVFAGAFGNVDFVYRSLIEIESSGSDQFCDLMLEACDSKTRDTLPLDWYIDIHRDGLFDKDQMFGVLEKEELTCLIDVLTKARDGVL